MTANEAGFFELVDMAEKIEKKKRGERQSNSLKEMADKKRLNAISVKPIQNPVKKRKPFNKKLFLKFTKEGLCSGDIARNLHVLKRDVVAAAKILGVTLKEHKKSNSVLAKNLKKLSHLSVKEAAKKLGSTYNKVWHCAQENGIQMRLGSKPKGGTWC